MSTDDNVEDYTLDLPEETKPTSRNERRSLGATALIGGLFAASVALWIVLIFIGIVSALPLTQLIIGSLHKNDCPINDFIPIYLIVAGAVGLFTALLSIFQVSYCFIFIQILEKMVESKCNKYSVFF